jgi:hypothetical protein
MDMIYFAIIDTFYFSLIYHNCNLVTNSLRLCRISVIITDSTHTVAYMCYYLVIFQYGGAVLKGS